MRLVRSMSAKLDRQSTTMSGSNVEYQSLDTVRAKYYKCKKEMMGLCQSIVHIFFGPTLSCVDIFPGRADKNLDKIWTQKGT